MYLVPPYIVRASVSFGIQLKHPDFQGLVHWERNTLTCEEERKKEGEEEVCVVKKVNGVADKTMAVCVAIIDKDNSPLLLEVSRGAEGEGEGRAEEELKLHYTVHSSLDIVEEKLNNPSGGTGRASDLRELYLGLLLSTEEYKVYGYASNTKIKFILVTELGNPSLKDQELRAIFKKLHNTYCDTVSSPFYVPGTQLNSKYLSKVVSDVLTQKK